MELTQEEKDERLAAENKALEDRIARKNAAAPAKKKVAPMSQDQIDHFRRIELAGGDQIEVVLVNSQNTSTVLQRELFPLDHGRIPIRHICNKWQISNPLWADIDEPIGEHPDGFSDTTFAGMKTFRIKGTVHL